MRERREEEGDKDNPLTGGSHVLDQSRGFQVGSIAGVEHEIGAQKVRGATHPNRGSK
jgi:hypothetical protein